MNILAFGFHIGIPFCPWRWKDFWYKRIPVTKNKTVEIQIDRTTTLIGVSLNWSIRSDHAGIRLELELLGIECLFSFEDNRHWDKETGTWEVYHAE